MSSDPFGPNPYAAPGPQSYPEKAYQPMPYGDAPAGPWTMNYFGAFDMIHRRPDWFVNTLLVGICGMIPILGGIVISGYSFECVEVLHRTNGTYYPQFDFNRFVDYLVRGVGPFLVQLVIGVVNFVMIMGGYLLFGILMIGAGAAAGDDPGPVMGIVAILGMLVFLGMVIVLTLLTLFLQIPLTLRGGLSGDIGQSFAIGWAYDFMKKMWVEMLLMFFFFLLIGIVLEIFVIVTCLIGIIPAIGYVMLINSWLLFNLYRVYLSRGGEPIPFKPAPLAMPMG